MSYAYCSNKMRKALGRSTLGCENDRGLQDLKP